MPHLDDEIESFFEDIHLSVIEEKNNYTIIKEDVIAKIGKKIKEQY